MLALPLLAVLEIGARRAKRCINRSAIELLAGVQTGLCIGVGNATLASGLQSTSKSWLEHVARQHIGSKVLTSPRHSMGDGASHHSSLLTPLHILIARLSTPLVHFIFLISPLRMFSVFSTPLRMSSYLSSPLSMSSYPCTSLAMSSYITTTSCPHTSPSPNSPACQPNSHFGRNAYAY